MKWNMPESIMKSSEITIDSEILSGTPVFRGTRVPVQSLFDWLETETLDEFLENFPAVSRDQAVRVLKLAKNLTVNQPLTSETST